VVGAGLVVLPLGARGLVGFVGDHHHQHVGGDVAAGLGGGLDELLGRGREGLGRVHALAEAEVVVGVLRGEVHARVALAGADHLHVGLRLRAQAAVVHLEVLALEVGLAGAPQVAQHLDVFGQVLVARAEELVAGPHAHLRVLGPLPAGDEVQAEAAVGDGVDGRGHARDDGRRHHQRGGGGEELDLAGDRREPGHERERLQVVVPELGLAAEAAQLDHRQREVDAVALGLQRDLLVELETGLVLRRVFGQQPAVVADGNEDADVHERAPVAGLRKSLHAPCQLNKSFQSTSWIFLAFLF
jgi:hypothetical protein